MELLSLGFDTRPAREGAEELRREAEQIKRSMREADEVVRRFGETLATSLRSGSGASQSQQAANAQVQAIERVTAAQTRATGARNADSQAIAQNEALQRKQIQQGLTALSTLGGEARAYAQLTRFRLRETQALGQEVNVAQTLAGVRAQLNQRTAEANAQFSTAAVKSRDLRTNMAGLNTNVGQLTRSLSVLTFGPLSGVGSRLITVQSAAAAGGASLVALALGATAVVGGLTALVRAGEQAERSQLRLQGVIRATGGAAGQTAESIEVISRRIGRETLASTADVRDAAAQLLTFRSIAGESFGRTLELAQDLAELGFGSIQTATVQLAKALEDPVANLSNLRRVGISVSQSQQDLIRDLVQTGQAAEAQTLILEILEKQVGGTGKAAAEGLAGSFDTLRENFQRFIELAESKLGVVETLALAIQGLNFGIFGEGVGVEPFDIDTQLFVLDEQIAKLQAREAQFRQNIATPGGLPPGEQEKLNALLAERLELEEKIRRTQEVSDQSASKQADIQLDQQTTAFGKLRSELDQTVRANEDYEQSLRIIDAAVASGVAGAAELAPSLRALARERLLGATANEEATRAQERWNEAQAKATQQSDQSFSELLRGNEILEGQIAALQRGEEALRAYNVELEVQQAVLAEIARVGPGTAEDPFDRESFEREARRRAELRQRYDDERDAIRENASEAKRAAEEIRRANERAAQASVQPWLNAAENIQRGVSDALFDAFRHGVSSAEDAADLIKDIFARLAAELVTVNLFGGALGNLQGGQQQGGGLLDLFGGALGLFGGSTTSTGLPPGTTFRTLGDDESIFRLENAVESGARAGSESGISGALRAVGGVSGGGGGSAGFDLSALLGAGGGASGAISSIGLPVIAGLLGARYLGQGGVGSSFIGAGIGAALAGPALSSLAGLAGSAGLGVAGTATLAGAGGVSGVAGTGIAGALSSLGNTFSASGIGWIVGVVLSAIGYGIGNIGSSNGAGAQAGRFASSGENPYAGQSNWNAFRDTLLGTGSVEFAIAALIGASRSAPTGAFQFTTGTNAFGTGATAGTPNSPFGDLFGRSNSRIPGANAQAILEGIAMLDQALVDAFELTGEELDRVGERLQRNDLIQGFAERKPSHQLEGIERIMAERSIAIISEVEGAAVGAAVRAVTALDRGDAPSAEFLQQLLSDFFRERAIFTGALRTLSGEEIPELETAFARLDAQLAEAIQSTGLFASRIGELEAATETGRQKIGTDFIDEIRRELSGDTFAAGIVDIERANAQLIANARIVELETGLEAEVLAIELAEQRKLRFIEEYAERSLAPLRALRDDLTIGDLGGVSLTNRLADARERFDIERAEAIANPFDPKEISEAAEAGRILAELGRDVFASGQGFQDIRNELLDFTDLLTSLNESAFAQAADIGGAEPTLGIPPFADGFTLTGPVVVEGASEQLSVSRELLQTSNETAANTTETNEELVRLREEVRGMKALLEQFLGDQMRNAAGQVT